MKEILDNINALIVGGVDYEKIKIYIELYYKSAEYRGDMFDDISYQVALDHLHYSVMNK